MDVSHIIDGLSDAQRAAVTAPLGSATGAGRCRLGQDPVLVHRIAWLIQVEGLSPWGILAVTFTNKAAREMKHRIEALLGDSRSAACGRHLPRPGPIVCCARTGRRPGLPQGFQILDSDDQQRVGQTHHPRNEPDDSKWPPRQAQWFINKQKDEACAPKTSTTAVIPTSAR